MSVNLSLWEHGEDAGYGHWYQGTPNGTLVCSHEDNIAWLKNKGTDEEMLGANICMWMAFAACLLCLSFYAYSTWRATCGWEEVYVCLVEMVKVMIEVFHENDSPATLYLSTGNFIMWIRYGEWLLSCPVILIHLSNITGLQDQYSKRTMQLLVSDLGTITMGVTAALCGNYVKWIFFILGLCYGVNTYFHAAKVYIESYHIVPKGVCRVCVRVMAWCFFGAWTCYPLLFVFGPEGLGVLSYNASAIGHTIIDIFSKQVWGFVGHYLRIKIHEHIVIHGNLVKPTKVKVAGMEIDAEEMVEKDEEGAI
nr:HdChR [synthetic construct]